MKESWHPERNRSSAGRGVVYEVYFTKEELELLGRLKGTEMHAVTSDGWAFFMRTGVGVYQVTVLEVSTPDESHPAGDVTRPQVGIGEEPESPIETDFTSQAEVDDVTVLRTVITMSEPERVDGGSNLHGVEMPSHMAYGPIYMHPEGEELDALKDRSSVGNAVSLTWLDVGFRLHFRDGEALSVHTDGATFFPTLSRGQELDQIPTEAIQEIPL